MLYLKGFVNEVGMPSFRELPASHSTFHKTLVLMQHACIILDSVEKLRR
jgi:hypothetical protein